MNKQSAPAAAVPNSHAMLLNPSIWNNIDPSRALWSMAHEPLHGEAGWKDYVNPNGQKYMRWNDSGPSPMQLQGTPALSNPDNAVCFIMGGC